MAAAVVGAFVLVYLWPVLVGGKILSPLTTLYGFQPWARYAPAAAHDHFNPLLTDVQMADYPWRWLVRTLLHDGVFPAWNPHVFAGIPLYANSQTGLFSPFSLPLWILPLDYGIGLAAALKLWAGAFGMYLLIRKLGLGFLPAILAGFSFSFSATNIVWLTHETLPAVVVMLPWTVWLIEGVHQGGGRRWVVGLAVATAIGLGGGHPGMQVHLLVAAAAYALLRTAFTREGTWRTRLRSMAWSWGGIALGTLLMAFMLIPELLLGQGTVGLSARSHGGTLPGADLPLSIARTVAFPDWWGRPSSYESEFGRPIGNFNERTLYAGAVALILAVIAAFQRRGWRKKAPFAVLAVVGLGVSLHAPALHWAATNLPILNQVQSQRMHFIFAFAVATLAAFGLQAVIDQPRAVRWRAAALVAAIGVPLIAIWSLDLTGADISAVGRHFSRGASLVGEKQLALTSVTWYVLFASIVAIAIVLAWRWPALRWTAAALVVLAAAVDAHHFAHGYQPMGSAATVIPPVTPAVRFLQSKRGDGRIVGMGPGLPNDWPLVYGLDDVRGYDPPQPSFRMYRLWQFASPDQDLWSPFWFEAWTPQAVRVISILGARHVYALAGVRTLAVYDSALRPVRRVYSGIDGVVFENPNAVPRVMLAPDVALVDGEQGALGVLMESDFDPRRTVVVEREQPGASSLARGPSAQGTVELLRSENARVELRARLETRGLVVLNDSWAPGWAVRVDGRRAPQLRVNDVMRGVIVDRGDHTITWSYRVPGLRAGLAMSALALLALLLISASPRVRRRTPRRLWSRAMARSRQGDRVARV